MLQSKDRMRKLCCETLTDVLNWHHVFKKGRNKRVGVLGQL